MIGYWEFLESLEGKSPMPTIEQINREHDDLMRDLPFQVAEQEWSSE